MSAQASGGLTQRARARLPIALGAVLVAAAAGTLLARDGAEPIAATHLVRSGPLALDPVTLEPYTGPVLATFERQRIVAREAYRDGLKDGPYAWYADSGDLLETGSYRDGVLDGPYRAYWSPGGITEEGTFRAGAFDGPRAWYRDGTLLERVTYVDGALDGPYERYRSDGTLDVRGTLVGGRPCGTWIEGDSRVDRGACAGHAEQ